MFSTNCKNICFIFAEKSKQYGGQDVEQLIVAMKSN